jgi:hypothetical protein
MTIKKRYIPLRDDDFFNWQGNFVNLVVTNAVDWNIPPDEVTALTTRRAEFEPLYTTAQNKTTRNRADVLAFRQSRQTYEKEIRAFVKAYLLYSPSVSDEERRQLALTVRDTEPTPRGKITSFPIIGLKGIGGGDIEVRCRVTTDQTRFSMHSLADAVECKYILVPKGEMPPESQKDAKTTVVSKKARFIISCGDEQAGESFWGFFRWVNLTNPANSGPWTKAQKVVIA